MEQCVYTVKEIAEKLKVSEKTVYSLVHDNEIRYIRIRGQIRILSKALEEYLEGGHKYETTNSRELVL